ncbi:hypothetical protein [Moorella sp. E308F]|uniref:hypothetical protein n=1 Tax=Moorella sp. E308F TaxID=2572682 RepID=UPI001C0ED3B0|nr:hypothetical protein [Moorella sp. E308F]
MTAIKGESFNQKLVEPGAVGPAVRWAHSVTTGLGGPEILFKNAVLPSDITPEKIGEAIQWQFYDVEASEYEFVYKNTDFSPDGNMTVVCAAVPKKMIEAFCTENSGVYTCLDVRPFALWRGFRFTHPGDGPTVLAARWPEGITVVGGRSAVEFVREMPASAALDSERMRTVDYFRRAFDAPDAAVVDLEGEELAYAVSAGYALAPFDPEQINLLPERHRRVRATEFKKPRLPDLVAAGLIVMAVIAAAPYMAARYYDVQAKEYRAAAARNAPAVQEAASLRGEISKYQEWIDVVSKHKITPYTAMVSDVRYAVPPGVMLDDLEIGDGTVAAAGPTTPPAGSKAAAVQPAPPAGGAAAGTSGQAAGQPVAGTPLRAGQPIPTDQKSVAPAQPAAGNGAAAANAARTTATPAAAQPAAPMGGMNAGQPVGSGSEPAGKTGTGSGQAARGNNAPSTAGKSTLAQNVKALYMPAVMRLSGKAEDLRLIGILEDNLSQLPYVESVKVEDASYNGVFYSFRISAKLKANR